MPSNDEQAIEQNRKNNILDLQLTGISIKLHERPDPCDSRPGSKLDLSRPMSAIPLYFKEKGRGGVRERPRSAGNAALRKKSSPGRHAARIGIHSASKNPLSIRSKGGWCRSEVSLSSISSSRSGGRMEPGLAAKPPLPPARPSHTQSLDDIVNINFLRWFPQSSHHREKEEDDEGLARCDSSLGNDDISDLASSDSRLGFTSPDIALNTEGNLRPGTLSSNTNIITDGSTTPLDSPHSNQKNISGKDYDTLYDKTGLSMAGSGSYKDSTVPSTLIKQSSCPETPRQTLPYDRIKMRPSDKGKSSVEGRDGSNGTMIASSSGFTHKRHEEMSQSTSDDTPCPSIIDKTAHQHAKTQGFNFNEQTTDFNIETNDQIGTGNKTANKNQQDKYQRDRDIVFEPDRFFENNSRASLTPTTVNTNLTTPEPILPQKPITRQSKVTYRPYRNATPDSLITPEPSMTPEPHSNTPREDRRVKRVTIDLCPETKRERNSADSVRKLHQMYDFDSLTVQPVLDSKDKASDDSGIRSLLTTSAECKATPTKDVISQPVSKHDEILSWMGSSLQAGGADEVTSTYDELMNMIQVIEHDEVESMKLDALSTGRSSVANSGCSLAPPPQVNIQPTTASHQTSDILGLLEGVEEAARSAPEPTRPTDDIGQQRTLTLAQRCMTLSDRLEAEKQRCADAERELNETKQSLSHSKEESRSTLARHQAFINQLLKEKKALGEQCAALVKDLEGKHRQTIRTLEERHAVDLKKQHDKLIAAEKLRKDKWIDAKTKKIKELTVAGVEEEVLRLGTTHQEEIRGMRRRHEEELSRLEAVWSRRLSQAREESARDREIAVSEERDAARLRLQAEVARLEGEEKEARRTLREELRGERHVAEIQMERTLADKSASLDAKYQQALAKLDDKLSHINKKHDEEVKRLREALEVDRISWLDRETQASAEREKEIRAEVKRERDKHIEAALRKLDQESVEKQKQLELKLARVKESWDEEKGELEAEVTGVRKKLKEARKEIEKANEETETVRRHARQESQASAAELAELRNRLTMIEDGRSGEQQVSAGKIAQLEHQLTEARQLHRQALADRQVQMDLLYNKVKEAVGKKDEQVRWLQRERDAAEEQCRQLEKILERRTAENVDD